MVLGLRAKNRNSPSVQVDYLIHIQDIKPWPPSQSLKSLRAVSIQWENGDRKSGLTKSVVPTIGSVVGEGKIEFNESFRLPVALSRDLSIKNADVDVFQKNCLEFNLYELRRDKTTKGQLLASAIVNLADYGIVKEMTSLNVPMNCKRSVRNTALPLLYVKIQPAEKSRTKSLSRDSLSKEASMDRNGGESVSALMNEEYAEEAEIASFTDDDVASHSSLTVSSSTFDSRSVQQQNEENETQAEAKDLTSANKKCTLEPKMELENANMAQTATHEKLKASSCTSSIDLSSGPPSPQNGHSSPSSPHSSSTSEQKNVNYIRHRVHGSFVAGEDYDKIPNGRSATRNGCRQIDMENSSSRLSPETASQEGSQKYYDNLEAIDSSREKLNGNDTDRVGGIGRDDLEAATADNNGFLVEKDEKEQNNVEVKIRLEEEKLSREEALSDKLDANEKENMVGNETLPSSHGNLRFKGSIQKSEHPKLVRSVRSSSDSAKTNGQHQYAKDINVISSRKEGGVFPKDSRSAILENKMQQLESRVVALEGELREAAAVEAAIYSVAAEHGCSMSKVHAPARRLSRLYLHACKGNIKSQMASAARTAVSGLILVAKACGNDVPRLTFWLSNSIVLRAIIQQCIEDIRLPVSSRSSVERSIGGKEYKEVASALKWKAPSSSRKRNINVMHEHFGDWEDPHTFTSALEKVEAWIFSRIIDSIWWQTLTPYMQSAVTKSIDKGVSSGSKKTYGRSTSSVDQEQGNFSLDLWKKAFKDACERLCPLRAGGHECGCLPLLSRLVMEQCVARLDVAMFNAILRESVEEIPTDPISDPISNPKVLPIPAGKSSFGAGAQLKNTIGNWSRWLTDLFDIDDEDLCGDEDECIDDDERQDKSFKSFYLLNALSDLMMLPKDMLLDRSIRKEVCPTFGAPLIKRVLDFFVPDEFCPDPVPAAVMEALDSEDPFEDGEECIVDFPCTAPPPLYSPPLADSVADIIGEVGRRAQLRRSGSSVLRKSYTSDDELDDLTSPLASILMDGSQFSQAENKAGSPLRGHGRDVVRYELLRDVWSNSE